jgi:hypothetical protein
MICIAIFRFIFSYLIDKEGKLIFVTDAIDIILT